MAPKKLLIISPHFPPTNAADMQRIRMSLPYYKKYGWDAEVVMVHEKYIDIIKDPLLLESIPKDIKIHKVKAFSKKLTSKIGLGDLAIRSMWFYKNKVNALIRKGDYDLIYFSTTRFPICVLGKYWKMKFNIPYIIDMQDLWHSDYYKNKPIAERPKKYWFSYRLHKFLEPIAMNDVDGLISVSEEYLETLVGRYPRLSKIPLKVITFGAFELDFQIAKDYTDDLKLVFDKTSKQKKIVYVGRGGFDMKESIQILLLSFKKGLTEQPQLFSAIHFYFVGTSYAPKGEALQTLAPIAAALGLSDFVTEYPERIGFYESIKHLTIADGLIIIGSNDSGYTASKLYPYILAKKQILAVFNPRSSAAQIFNNSNAGHLISFENSLDACFEILKVFLEKIMEYAIPKTDWNFFEAFTADSLTKDQVDLFNDVLTNQNK